MKKFKPGDRVLATNLRDHGPYIEGIFVEGGPGQEIATIRQGGKLRRVWATPMVLVRTSPAKGTLCRVVFGDGTAIDWWVSNPDDPNAVVKECAGGDAVLVKATPSIVWGKNGEGEFQCRRIE